jgi:hypothetical protein
MPSALKVGTRAEAKEFAEKWVAETGGQIREIERAVARYTRDGQAIVLKNCPPLLRNGRWFPAGSDVRVNRSVFSDTVLEELRRENADVEFVEE